jgi:hypothetical protein
LYFLLNKTVLKTFLLLLLVSIINFSAYSQCDDKNRVFHCAKIFGDTITYLNDFDIRQDKRKSLNDPNGEVWDIYLMKGTEYRLALCCPAGIDDKVLRLFDENSSEEMPIISTGSGRRSLQYIDFICTRSGIYHVSIRFKEDNLIGKELIATGLLGFIRKVK